MKIKFHKLRDDVIIPKRMHYNDAGADVYTLEKHTVIYGGETAVLACGFGVDIPDGFMGIMLPRSSTCKKGLLIGGTPIDSGYHGEVHVVVTNLGKDEVVIEKGDRLAQLVIQPVIMAEYVEELGEDRGTGAFGSTGR